jgi:hypothetical protein
LRIAAARADFATLEMAGAVQRDSARITSHRVITWFQFTLITNSDQRTMHWMKPK